MYWAYFWSRICNRCCFYGVVPDLREFKVYWEKNLADSLERRSSWLWRGYTWQRGIGERAQAFLGVAFWGGTTEAAALELKRQDSVDVNVVGRLRISAVPQGGVAITCHCLGPVPSTQSGVGVYVHYISTVSRGGDTCTRLEDSQIMVCLRRACK